MLRYIITNGDTYIAESESGSRYATPDISKAITFCKNSKAVNYISTLPGHLRGKGYYAKISNEIVSADDNAGAVHFKAIRFDDNTLASLKSDVSVMQRVFSDAQRDYVNCCEMLQRVEQEIIDIEHAIEFMSLNASKGYEMYRRLRDARKRRRNYKDTKAILEGVLNYTTEDWQNERMEKLLNSMENRCYIPRELPELFK